MIDAGLPEPVASFLSLHITSIEQLEVLLLLRNKPEREWSRAELTRELGSSAASIELRLQDLAARGFIVGRPAEHGPVFRYGPDDERARELIDGLAKAYRERRLTVINLIYGRPPSDIQSFADAFSLAKKEKKKEEEEE